MVAARVRTDGYTLLHGEIHEWISPIARPSDANEHYDVANDGENANEFTVGNADDDATPVPSPMQDDDEHDDDEHTFVKSETYTSVHDSDGPSPHDDDAIANDPRSTSTAKHSDRVDDDDVSVDDDRPMTVVQIWVETLNRSIEDESSIYDNVLNRVQERGSILALTVKNDSLWVRMNTETSCLRVIERTDGCWILGGTVRIRSASRY